MRDRPAIDGMPAARHKVETQMLAVTRHRLVTTLGRAVAHYVDHHLIVLKHPVQWVRPSTRTEVSWNRRSGTAQPSKNGWTSL